MSELYGLPRDNGERTYLHWRRALHPLDAQRAEDAFRAAVATRCRYHSEFRVVLPDGSIRYIRAIGTVYEDAAGVSKIVGVNWDVTADVRSMTRSSAPKASPRRAMPSSRRPGRASNTTRSTTR